MNSKKLLIGTIAICLSLNCFSQDCDRFINNQTNTVNAKGVVVRVLGLVSDGIFGTRFSNLANQANSQLQMLDVVQYNICMQMQGVRNSFVRENYEQRARNTMEEMVKLLKQSGSLPPEAVTMLAENGIAMPAETPAPDRGSRTIAPADNDAPAPSRTQPTTGDEVPTPRLPVTEQWVTVTFPCQPYATSGGGNVIRARGMETHSDPQIARSIANVIALEELASKVEVAVNSVTEYYIRAVSGSETNEELIRDFKRNTTITVNQVLRGYRTVCEEFRQNTVNQRWQSFVALEIDKDQVLKPVHEELKRNNATRDAVPNYEKFKEAFNEVNTFLENTGI